MLIVTVNTSENIDSKCHNYHEENQRKYVHLFQGGLPFVEEFSRVHLVKGAQLSSYRYQSKVIAK